MTGSLSLLRRIRAVCLLGDGFPEGAATRFQIDHLVRAGLVQRVGRRVYLTEAGTERLRDLGWREHG